MKKIIITSIIFVLIMRAAATAQSYRPATPEEQKELALKITEASKQLKTLRCDFVQKKTVSILSDELVSEGELLYRQPDKLCWEYVKPYQYSFILNDDKIMIVSEKEKNIIDTNSSKIFKEISKLIMLGISGAGIFSEDKFIPKFYVGTQDCQVVLTPKQKELKQMFSSITLTFNKTDYSVNTVEIKEISDDISYITIKNKQINIPLSDEVFSIR